MPADWIQRTSGRHTYVKFLMKKPSSHAIFFVQIYNDAEWTANSWYWNFHTKIAMDWTSSFSSLDFLSENLKTPDGVKGLTILRFLQKIF